MPIVTIELLTDTNTQPVGGQALQALTDALGSLFGSRTSGTWVKLRYLDRRDYAENADPGLEGVNPTFVEILKSDDDDAGARRKEATAISRLVARHLNRPEDNVHVLYQPSARGRMAFGGRLLT